MRRAKTCGKGLFRVSRGLFELQAGPEGGVDQRYIKEGVNFKQYNKIMLDQVRFYFKNDAADKGIDAAEMKELADTLHKDIIDALGRAYPLVAKPGPNVMRIRIAITDMELPNRALNTVTPLFLPAWQSAPSKAA